MRLSYQGIATGSEIIEVTADIGFGTSEETSHEYLDIDDQIAQINMSEPDYLQLDDHVFEMSPFDDHVFEMGPFDDDDPQ
ncbi:NAC domain-containing protein 2 [Prunus yedoensis var. nudiflora]|uniref:NAC domain-containing protein 2 n=1 Tax=Prunus yedoensis var. nudiflora TaxID=2094558 RepID=A0A314Z3K8_PRUYE|nr:NAC domain-containing protein 2 [Prunus yedoensis var. nudiflora]